MPWHDVWMISVLRSPLPRRLGHAFGVLLLVSILAFLFADLAPGDAFSQERLDPRLSAETLESWRARAGLDAPLPVRYGRWLRAALSGDLGMSVAHRRPVSELIWPRLGATLALTTSATVFAWGIALLVGGYAATRPGGALDRLTGAFTAGLQALPELLLALLAAMAAVRLGLPVGGASSLDADQLSVLGRLADRLRHAALPVATLTLAALPALVPHVRAAVGEALGAPAVLAARGYGLGGARLFFGYVMPLAANPLISLAGVSFGALVSGSLVVEVVLGWPGVGPLMLGAVLARDLPVVVAGALLSAAFLLIGNLLADLALYRLDPRLADGVPE